MESSRMYELSFEPKANVDDALFEALRVPLPDSTPSSPFLKSSEPTINQDVSPDPTLINETADTFDQTGLNVETSSAPTIPGTDSEGLGISLPSLLDNLRKNMFGTGIPSSPAAPYPRFAPSPLVPSLKTNPTPTLDTYPPRPRRFHPSPIPFHCAPLMSSGKRSDGRTPLGSISGNYCPKEFRPPNLNVSTPPPPRPRRRTANPHPSSSPLPQSPPPPPPPPPHMSDSLPPTPRIWILYDLLGVEKGVSEEEVRAGYRRTAVRNHPDKFPEEEREKANERMMRINAARDVLVDPARRRVYDETGRVP